MKIFLITLIAIVFSACVSKQPAMNEYRVNTNLDAGSLNANSCSKKSLKVAQAFSPSLLKSFKMYYTLGDTKQYAYSQSQWSTSPNKAVTTELMSLLNDTKLFKNVLVAASRGKSDLILETTIEEYMQHFNDESTKSYASVKITLTLIDSKSNIALDTKRFNSHVDAKLLNAQGGVTALNEALSNVLKESTVWFEGVCQ